LSISNALAGDTSQPQALTGGLIFSPLANISQPQSLSGSLVVSSASISLSSAISALQDSTGMTQVVSSFGDDVGQYLPDIGFNFPIYGSTYRSNISIGSNWYLLFGSVSNIFSGMSHAIPGRGLLFGAADRSWQKVYFKAESGFCRIRYEGRVAFGASSATAIFQIKLFADGTIELTIGIGAFYNLSVDVMQSLTKGDGITYTDFTVPAGSTAQIDFFSTDVLTSLVFRPVDAIGSSHTVQVGSYLPLLGGGVSQSQSLRGSLVVVKALSAPMTQPQNLTGGLSAIVALMGSIAQSQGLAGSLSVSSLLNGAAIQPQVLTGSLFVSNSLLGNVSQTQSVTGSLTGGNALIGSVNQPQSLAANLTITTGSAVSVTPAIALLALFN